jgi:hypothetical protein
MDWSKIKNKIYFITILVLVIIILLQKCGGSGKKIKTDTIRTIDTTYVNIDREIPTYIPKWRTRVEHDTIYDVDTAYGLGVGLNGQFRPTVSFKFYWKIDTKK